MALRHFVFMGLLLMGLSRAVHAEAKFPKDTNGAKQLCMDFVETLETKGVQMAFLDYRPLFHVNAAEVAAMRESIKQQMFVARPTYGPPLRFELLNQTELGQSLLRVHLAEIFLHDVVFWQCTFYKPQDHWKLSGIEMSVDPDTVFP